MENIRPHQGQRPPTAAAAVAEPFVSLCLLFATGAGAGAGGMTRIELLGGAPGNG